MFQPSTRATKFHLKRCWVYPLFWATRWMCRVSRSEPRGERKAARRGGVVHIWSRGLWVAVGGGLRVGLVIIGLGEWRDQSLFSRHSEIARVACRIVRRDGQTKYRPRAPRTRCRRRCPMKATACNGNDHRCWTWPSPFTQLRPQCSVRPSLKIFIYILVLSCLQPSSLRGLAALRMILLHSFLSSVDCSNWSCFNHVHFLMLSSQYILGLPRLRWPGINEHLIMVINEDIC